MDLLATTRDQVKLALLELGGECRVGVHGIIGRTQRCDTFLYNGQTAAKGAPADAMKATSGLSFGFTRSDSMGTSGSSGSTNTPI